MTKIKVGDVMITLNQEQLDEIDRQRKGIYNIKDIDSVEIAEKILEGVSFHEKFVKKQFVRVKDWISYQIETIIKAANYLDNDKREYTPDFDDRSTEKYFVWFRKEKSGWVVNTVACYYYYSDLGSGFHFKVRNTAQIIAENNLELFNQWLPNK